MGFRKLLMTNSQKLRKSNLFVVTEVTAPYIKIRERNGLIYVRKNNNNPSLVKLDREVKVRVRQNKVYLVASNKHILFQAIQQLKNKTFWNLKVYNLIAQE